MLNEKQRVALSSVVAAVFLTGAQNSGRNFYR